MVLYISIFILMYLLLRNPVHSNYQYKKRCFFAFGILFVWLGFRVNCSDYGAYKDIFDIAQTSGIMAAMVHSNHAEIGWVYINYLIPSWRLLVLIETGLFCYVWAYLMYKHIPKKYVGLFLFLLFATSDKTVFFMTCAMRNSITVAVLLISVLWIDSYKKLLWAIPITIAMYFIHSSAIAIYPISYALSMWARKRKMGKREQYVWIVLMALFFILPVEQIFSPVFNLLNDETSERYGELVNSEGVAAKTMASIAGVGLVSGLLFYLNKFAKGETEFVIGRLSLIYCLSYLMGSLNARIPQYYIYFMVMICTIIYSNKMIPKQFRLVYVVFFWVVVLYGFYITETTSSESFFDIFKTLI